MEWRRTNHPTNKKATCINGTPQLGLVGTFGTFALTLAVTATSIHAQKRQHQPHGIGDYLTMKHYSAAPVPIGKPCRLASAIFFIIFLINSTHPTHH